MVEIDSSASTTVRSQDEIVARLAECNQANDFFGVRAADLIVFLDFEHAQPYIKEGTTAENWAPLPDPLVEARDYLPFAIDKARNHRGLSAARSVDHFKEWAWLSGDEKFVAALANDYQNYGAPILRAVATAIDAEDIWLAHVTPGLFRMAHGLACTDDCEEGCVK